MTKCSKNEGNRKSTVYNQNGENYFEQVSAYNSMCAHLRRLLLAKHVVDTKNTNYMAKKNQRNHKTDDYKPRFIREDLSDSTIDRLAVGVYQYPTMIQRKVEYNVKQDSSPWKYCTECYKNCQSSGFEDNDMSVDSQSRASSSSARTRLRSPSTRTKQRNPLLEINIKTTGSKLVVGKAFSKGGYTFFNQRFEDDTLSSPSVSNVEIPTRSSNHLSVLSGLTKWQQNYESNQKEQRMIATRAGFEKDEKEKYAKFVYNITRDIMENGRFSDADLHEVFKKHISLNKGKLNMSKMLFEVYQLKVSLNMVDDSELAQDLEDFGHKQQLMNIPDIRSPNSPKVTEDKVSQKLVSYRALPNVQQKSSGEKAVVPINLNSELLVTEKDILLSLMDAGIEPKVAQRICKSLYCKSRSPSLTDSNRLDIDHVAVEADEIQSPNSHYLNGESTPYAFDTTRKSSSKENKDTQINWLTSN